MSRLLLAALLLSLPACQVELDKVRADLRAYKTDIEKLRPRERELKRRIREFDGKIFTNQKAGVDLLKAVLVKMTRAFARDFAAVKPRSHLIAKRHRTKAGALSDLAAAYQALLIAYPQEDFDAIRAGLKKRDLAMRRIAAAELSIAKMLRKYSIK